MELTNNGVICNLCFNYVGDWKKSTFETRLNFKMHFIDLTVKEIV